MTRLHPFFAIGTVGMIVTAVLHIGMALGTGQANTAFLPLYPAFIAFLAIGTGLSLAPPKGR